MSSDEIIVKVQNLGKCYQLYDQPQDRLKQSILPRFQRWIGRTSTNYFREFWALKDVSFEVKRGEVVGIIGRNGSGKSTLLQIICGTLNPSCGTVDSRGQIGALLELGSGFNPEFSGIENVNLYGQVLGLSQERIQECLPSIIKFADIGKFLYQPVKTYSSGMMVRLAFAVSVSREPDLLVVDEALAVGDVAFQAKCYARINELCEKGTAVLFVSHAASLIVEICDRAIFLDAGQLLYEGPPPETVALYHKFAYASDEKREKVRSEILASRNGSKDKVSQKDSVFGGKNKPSSSPPKPFLDPNLVALSYLEYEQLGARIVTPVIETISGKPVNHLISGEEYIYTYTVVFQKDASQVQFGMLIKSVSGFEIGGAMHPSVGERIPQVKKNSKLTVRLSFQCMLNPGTYFMNAGVKGVVGEEFGFLHRVIDAVAFRVLAPKGRNGTSYVNFNVASSLKIIEI